jgi:hypothetical protein
LTFAAPEQDFIRGAILSRDGVKYQVSDKTKKTLRAEVFNGDIFLTGIYLLQIVEFFRKCINEVKSAMCTSSSCY